MARHKKFHGYSYKAGSPADGMIQAGQALSKGLSKVTALVKERSARRHLPEHLQGLVMAIESFQPAKAYHREVNYQTELTGWLKAKLSATVTIEEARGRSRPDIVVASTIAIEIKGPTTNQELKTIPDKVIRYRQKWASFVAVLFDIQDEVRYREWLRGMQERFPDAVVIRKP